MKTIVKQDKQSTKKSLDNLTFSQYTRVFGSNSHCWDDNREYNLMFLRMVQQKFNELLQIRGHVFLNEVFDALGLARTRTGQIVGWIYNEENPIGDNFVEISFVENEATNEFILDFNVDGFILDHI